MEKVKMHFIRRMYLKMNGALKTYGPSALKKTLWDKEYSTDKWDFAYDTQGDCVYAHLEKYAAGGDILDLGCGTGNTANELPISAYRRYVGVDVSEICLGKARKRSQLNGRGAKNQFVLGDLLSYVPSQQFNVILFRESMYHVPIGKIKAMLDRYSQYLDADGVFVVRMHTTDGVVARSKPRPAAMMRVIESGFDVVEKRQYGDFGPTVIVVRPAAHRTSYSETADSRPVESVSKQAK
jgi:SAM-dependent methyltransferase